MSCTYQSSAWLLVILTVNRDVPIFHELKLFGRVKELIDFVVLEILEVS